MVAYSVRISLQRAVVAFFAAWQHMAVIVIWSAVSHWFPPNASPEATVFHARYKAKFRSVACVVGRGPSRRGKLQLEANAFLACSMVEKGALSIRHVSLSTYWEVALGMREAFRLSEPREALLLLCADEHLYTQACSLLNAQFSLDDLKHFVWQEPAAGPDPEQEPSKSGAIPLHEIDLDALRGGGRRRSMRATIK